MRNCFVCFLATLLAFQPLLLAHASEASNEYQHLRGEYMVLRQNAVFLPALTDADIREFKRNPSDPKAISRLALDTSIHGAAMVRAVSALDQRVNHFLESKTGSASEISMALRLKQRLVNFSRLHKELLASPCMKSNDPRVRLLTNSVLYGALSGAPCDHFSESGAQAAQQLGTQGLAIAARAGEGLESSELERFFADLVGNIQTNSELMGIALDYALPAGADGRSKIPDCTKAKSPKACQEFLDDLQSTMDRDGQPLLSLHPLDASRSTQKANRTREQLYNFMRDRITNSLHEFRSNFPRNYSVRISQAPDAKNLGMEFEVSNPGGPNPTAAEAAAIASGFFTGAEMLASDSFKNITFFPNAAQACIRDFDPMKTGKFSVTESRQGKISAYRVQLNMPIISAAQLDCMHREVQRSIKKNMQKAATLESKARSIFRSQRRGDLRSQKDDLLLESLKSHPLEFGQTLMSHPEQGKNICDLITHAAAKITDEEYRSSKFMLALAVVSGVLVVAGIVLMFPAAAVMLGAAALPISMGITVASAGISVEQAVASGTSAYQTYNLLETLKLQEQTAQVLASGNMPANFLGEQEQLKRNYQAALSSGISSSALSGISAVVGMSLFASGVFVSQAQNTVTKVGASALSFQDAETVLKGSADLAQRLRLLRGLPKEELAGILEGADTFSKMFGPKTNDTLLALKLHAIKVGSSEVAQSVLRASAGGDKLLLPYNVFDTANSTYNGYIEVHSLQLSNESLANLQKFLIATLAD